MTTPDLPHTAAIGLVGKGVMVLAFEEGAFSLPAGQVSEPVRTDFGYHLVEVIEKDLGLAKDEARLQQERAENWKAWMNEQIAGDQVKRAKNLMDFMLVGMSGETGTELVLVTAQPTGQPTRRCRLRCRSRMCRRTGLTALRWG